MATPPIPVETLQAAIDAVASHGNVAFAARAMKIPEATLRYQVKEARRRLLSANAAIIPATPEQPAAPIREPLTSFEEAWAQWQRCIGMAKDRHKTPVRKARQGTQKILVVPDLHAPFHEAEMFAEMIVREADADKVIMIGDVGDSYALSRFTKYERMPYRDEWASVTLCLQELASRFPDVEIVLGNHDARLERQLRERLTEDMVDAVSFITGGILCPITALARRYPNVRIARHVTPDGESIDWFTTVGDAWLGHPEKFSRTPGAALRQVEEWIADNEMALGLDRYRLVVLGHTHAHSMIPWHARQLLVECGCLAKTQGYMRSSRIGGRPQRRGYLTFEQTDGRTDLNSVRFYNFDYAKEQAA